jgi:hypothetical protein
MNRSVEADFGAVDSVAITGEVMYAVFYTKKREMSYLMCPLWFVRLLVWSCTDFDGRDDYRR